MFGKKYIQNIAMGDRLYLEDNIEELVVVDLLPLLRDRISVAYTANRLAVLMCANIKDVISINGKKVER